MFSSHLHTGQVQESNRWRSTFLHRIDHQAVGGEFPIDAYPPMVQEAVWAVQQDLHVPLALIAASFLGAMSLACQGVYDVSPRAGQSGPCGCYVLILAESGTGKSPVLDRVFAPFRQFERHSSAKYQQELADFKAKHRVWRTIEKALLSTVSKKTQKGKSTEFEQRLLLEHADKEPVPPKWLRLLYDDVTPEALKSCWYENGSSLAIVSAEAGEVLNGRAFANLYLFNQVWGGESVSSARNTSESFTVTDPRCSMTLCVQPEVFRRFIDGRGKAAVENGFLVRNLVVQIEEQSVSSYVPVPADETALSAFHEKVCALLDIYVKSQGEGRRECLCFSQEATRRWQVFCSELKLQTQPGGHLAEFKDYVAKLSNHVVRVAALFHVFNGDEGKISVTTYLQAEKLCHWFAEEYLSLFPRDVQVSLHENDAGILLSWLTPRLQGGPVRVREILQRGPYALRSKVRRDAALAFLVQQGCVSRMYAGKTALVCLPTQPF